MKAPLDAASVSARLRELGRATDLRAEHRLATKIDLTAQGVTRRLRTVGRLTSLCRRLGRHRPDDTGTR